MVTDFHSSSKEGSSLERLAIPERTVLDKKPLRTRKGMFVEPVKCQSRYVLSKPGG